MIGIKDSSLVSLPDGVEWSGDGGEAECDGEHPPVDQVRPVWASQPSQAEDQGGQDVDSLEEKLNDKLLLDPGVDKVKPKEWYWFC